jgi:heat shock protein HtpX
VFEQISENKFKSGVLVFCFLALIFFLVWLLQYLLGMGAWGFVLALAVASASAFFSYWASDKIVLAMSRARPVTKEEFPYLYNVVEGLAIAAGIPAPRCYVIDDTAPNAFATGRNPEHSVVCVTTGLLQKLNRVELEGVIGHEMSHIRNYDIRLQTLTVVMVGMVSLLSDWILRGVFWGGGRRRSSSRDRGGGQLALVLVAVGLVLAVLSPVISQLIRLAISRKREFLADASSAQLTRYPAGLASALRKLASDIEPLEAANKATAHLYIVNPLKNVKGVVNKLFSTHPPIEERIAALERM